MKVNGHAIDCAIKICLGQITLFQKMTANKIDVSAAARETIYKQHARLVRTRATYMNSLQIDADRFGRMSLAEAEAIFEQMSKTLVEESKFAGSKESFASVWKMNQDAEKLRAIINITKGHAVEIHSAEESDFRDYSVEESA